MASTNWLNSLRGHRSGGRRPTAERKRSQLFDRLEPVFSSGLDDDVLNDPVVALIGSEVDGILDSCSSTLNQRPFLGSRAKNSKGTVSFDEAVSFALTLVQRPLEDLITGARDSGVEVVRGTQGDDLIADGDGNDQLIGLSGADDFLFDDAEAFGRKQADVIKDFSSAEGDRLLLDAAVFGDEASLGVAESRRQLKQMANDSDFDLLYFEPKGRLFFNENGNGFVFGDGGLVCIIKNALAITADQIALV